MTKLGFWSDAFEQLAELGQSTAKQTVKGVTQTFSPLKILEKTLSSNIPNPPTSLIEKREGANQLNHTTLNFEKLQQKYAEQDKAKTETLRQRLFQLVKRGEEEILQKEKQEELEKKRLEAYREQKKQRKQQEKKLQEQQAETPKGKIRRSIFSPKKVAQRQQAEVKPATGKQ